MAPAANRVGQTKRDGTLAGPRHLHQRLRTRHDRQLGKHLANDLIEHVTEATEAPTASKAQTGYPACVITHPLRTFLRRSLTVLLSVASVVVAAPLSAHADTPAAWPDAPSVSGLHFLVVLFLIPLGIAIVVSVLAALPSMIGDKGYEPGQSWRTGPEWFGGPRKGGEAVDEVAPATAEDERGGTSARW